MKFYTWTATQKGAVCPYTGGLKLLLVSNFGSTVFKSAICAASSHKSMKSCSAATIFFLSTLNLSGETLCQKLHFMYYRRPLREYSCVINFHFKAKSSWNDVSEWVWSGANSNGNKKNEINNNAQRETASHSGTQQKYVFLKTWMRVYSSRLSLHTHTHTPSGHGFDFLPCYLIWLSYESRFLTACGEPLTIPSSHLYYTTYAVSPPANPPPPPPPQSP